MPSDFRIITQATTYYLINSSGTPTSGGAATAANTTPFALLNDNWTVQNSVPVTAFQGGPPMRNGSALAYQAYANTVQSIPMSVTGSSHDNVASLMRSFKQLINQYQWYTPALFYYQPNGATNPMYFEIISGYIQERPDPLNPSGGFTYVEFDLIITLSPFAGRLTTPETIVNSVTYTTGGSTANPSGASVFMGLTGSGDQIFEGSPLNLKITPTDTSGTIGQLWVATVFQDLYTTVNSALNVPGGAAVTTSPGHASTGVLHDGAWLRVMARVQNTTGGAVSKYYLVIRASWSSSAVVWTSPGVSPTAENPGIVDFGPIPYDIIRNLSIVVGNLSFDFFATKTAGTPTLISVTSLLYATFASITNLNPTTAGGQYIWLNSFMQRSNRVCLPLPQSANTMDSTNTLYNPAVLRGQLPVYLYNTNLWMNWVNASLQQPTAATMTATVLATHAPLYNSMRGAG